MGLRRGAVRDGHGQAAVLKEKPNLTLAPEKTRRLLRRCLEKDPKNRLRDIGDWKMLLEEDVVHAASAAFRPAWITAVAVLGAITAAVLAGAGIAALLIR